jgi:hypothetical protein
MPSLEIRTLLVQVSTLDHGAENAKGGRDEAKERSPVDFKRPGLFSVGVVDGGSAKLPFELPFELPRSFWRYQHGWANCPLARLPACPLVRNVGLLEPAVAACVHCPNNNFGAVLVPEDGRVARRAGANAGNLVRSVIQDWGNIWQRKMLTILSGCGWGVLSIPSLASCRSSTGSPLLFSLGGVVRVVAVAQDAQDACPRRKLWQSRSPTSASPSIVNSGACLRPRPQGKSPDAPKQAEGELSPTGPPDWRRPGWELSHIRYRAGRNSHNCTNAVLRVPPIGGSAGRPKR